MQVSIETTSGLERRLTVGVPASRVDDMVNARLKEAAKTIRLNGFRPGKVPLKVVRQRFGEGVRQEVVGELVNQTFYEAVMQEKLQPVGAPAIEPKQVEAGKDLEYVATFEVYPEIEVAQLQDVSINKPVASVTEADIDKMIGIFREQQATWADVDRACELGDKVNIDYRGLKDGEAFEGGTAEGADLELGSGRMIPGFEDGIIGMSAGEEKTIDVTFPEEYHSEELKGAAVQFEIKCNKVTAKELAELNEEFFQKYGVESADEATFRSEIRKNMERELRNAIKGRVKTQVLDAVLEANADAQVPAAAIDAEIRQLKMQALKQYGMADANMDLDMLPSEMFKAQAERRVKLGFILGELVKAKNLTADPAKVREMVEDVASTYQDPDEVIDYYYGNKEQLQGIENAVLEDQVVEVLLEDITVNEVESTYEDALKAPQNADDSEAGEGDDA